RHRGDDRQFPHQEPRGQTGRQRSDACGDHRHAARTAAALTREPSLEESAERRANDPPHLATTVMSIRTSVGAAGLTLALATQPAAALDTNVRITQYRHTAWRVEEGAFESAPNVIAQTADGYIWIGTDSGLVRFDGVRFQPWTPPQKNLF